MREFQITKPIAGHVSITVEAENEQEALEKFDEEFFDEKYSNLLQNPNIEYEWDIYDKLVEGNVCYTHYTETDITDLGEIED